MKMKIQISLAVLFAIAWVCVPAFATGSYDYDDDMTVEQEQNQGQGQEQYQDQTTDVNLANDISIENAAAGGSAINEGNAQSVEFNSNYQAQAPDVVLIPNNNTERCLRVWGLSFSNQSGGGGLGLPMRSKECDLEAAADDAFAQGNLDLGWMMKCKMKSMKKAFGGRQWKSDGERLCFVNAMDGVSQTKTIRTLTETLKTVSTEREIERTLAKESRERITQMCNESKNKILAACTNK